jgi:sugar phosphate isomerase/epimerase
VNLCASELRFAFGAGIPQIVRLAADTGFEGIAIGPACCQGDIAPLVAASVSARLVVPLAAAPLGEGPLGDGRRLPTLAAMDDSDERRAALALFVATLDAAVPLGIAIFTVDMGEVPLRTSQAEVARRFARQELDDEGSGARVWAAALGERRALSGSFLDACRIALDRMLRVAERRHVQLAIEIAGDPWRGPSPREALALLGEYREGPIGVVWDPARMQALRALGVAPASARRDELVAAALVLRANEAVGMEVGYLPGLGDPADPDAAMSPIAPAKPPAGASVVVTGRRDSTPDEVTRARVLAAGESAI